MKKLSYYLGSLFILSFIFSGCNKTKYGDVTFWKNSNGMGVIDVTIDGETSSITDIYASTPDCGWQGCAVFNDLEIGSYNYTATNGVDSWSGDLDISEGCLTIELY
tara:strand:+ start:2175 stop:2492 length:318 start_codon:yes stop_codon:yes gene_type:complete